MATLRVNGFASGMDIDSIVKQMMTAKRKPLDKLTQQKQVMEWQRDNYREFNSKFVDFKNNKLTSYQKSAAMNTQSAVVSGDTTAFKAEATSEANGVSMEINVVQLAKPATVLTSGAQMIKPDNSRLTSSSTLADLQNLNGGTGTATYSITINGANISLSKDLSINEFLSKINNAAGANVTAKFDEVTGKLSIASKAYNSTENLTLTDTDGLLGLFGGKMTPGAGEDTNGDGVFDYQPAKVKINGIATPYEFASNNFKINGINITLLSENKTGTVTTTTDPTKALETIKSFVADYNTLLGALNTKISEERYSDYTPLTEEQKKEMTDNQIEAWESKAKSGLLKNDEILKSSLNAMRSALADKLGELSAFGITTGQYYENGKLYIDEDKLKAALTNNPQEVTKIFQGSSENINTGLISKLSTEMTNAIEKLSTKAGTSKYSSDITAAFKSDSLMGKQLSDYTKRISDLQDRMDDYEDNLYKKFTAMETAISKYNSQSSSLASYMSS